MIPILLKNILKKYSFYRHLQYIWRSYIHYRKTLSYLYYRFWVGLNIEKRLNSIEYKSTTQDYSIHIICGHNDIDMLIWSIYSWKLVVHDSPEIYIHEDGTFTEKDFMHISNLLPDTKIIDYETSTENADKYWLKQYPYVRSYRLDSLNIYTLKLIDPFFVSESPYILILDSDILWFNKPHELLYNIEKHTEPVFWTNYIQNIIKSNSNHNINSYINSGVVYLKKTKFDLNSIDKFCKQISPNQFYDQECFTYLFNEYDNITLLPSDKYIIEGPVLESTKAKHYTNPRRVQFWFEGVRHINKNYSNDLLH